MVSRAITVVTFASLTCVHGLAAQTAPDMVPIEFVSMLGLTTAIGTGPAQVTVGRLPDRLANDLMPGPDTRIIGTLGSARFSTSALVMPGRAADIQERLVARLVEKGWKRPRAAPPPAPRGGFEMRVRERAAVATLRLCSTDDYNVQVAVSGYRGDSAAVRFFLIRGGMDASCIDPELTSSSSPGEQVPIPALRAPAGTEHRGGGYGTRGSEYGTAEGRLRSDMAPAALLEHYAAQMITAGWQPGARTSSAEVALQVFRKTDDSRVNWQGVLYVIALPDRERDLYLRLTRER